MKIRLFLAHLLVLLPLAGSAKGQTSVQKLGLGGKVKSYTIYRTTDSKGKISGQDKQEEYHFDKKGNLTEHTVYKLGEVNSRTKSAIDNKGKILEEKTITKNGDALQKKNTYDKHGRLIASTVLNKDGILLQKDSITYYKRNKKESHTRYKYQLNGDLTQTQKNCYDKNGRLVQHKMVVGKRSTTEHYTYNKNGDISFQIKIEEYPHNPNDTIIKSDTILTNWYYNGFGHLGSKTMRAKHDWYELWSYTCDIRGLRTEEFHYHFPSTDSAQPNQLLDDENHMANHLKDYHKFRYDNHGNKTAEWHYEGKEIKFTEGKIYEITYYK